MPPLRVPLLKVWDRRAKRVLDLGVSGRRTTLVWRRRRFECGNCGERHLEDHDQFRWSYPPVRRRLVADARVMSMSGGGNRHHGVGWHRIMGLVRAEAAQVAERRRARPCRVLLVDETVDSAPAPVCDRGRLPYRQSVGDDPGSHESVFGQVLQGSRSLVVPPGGDSRPQQVPPIPPRPSHNTFPTLAMCSTASMSPAGSPKDSPTYDGRYNTAASRSGGRQRSGRTCLRARFTCSAGRSTVSPKPTKAHLDRLFDAHPRLRTA